MCSVGEESYHELASRIFGISLLLLFFSDGRGLTAAARFLEEGLDPCFVKQEHIRIIFDLPDA